MNKQRLCIHKTWPLFLGVSIVLGLACACGGAQHGRAAGPADRDLLALAPKGAAWLGILDLESLRASPWWPTMKGLSAENEELKGLKDKSGVDPEQ